MERKEGFYCFPPIARRKIKVAQQENYPVFICAMTGFGKTEFVKQYLKKKTYIYIDAMTALQVQFEIPNLGKRQIIVIDNLQFAEEPMIRECIESLFTRNDLWIVMISRAQVPTWLTSVYYKETSFLLIGEKELELGKKEIIKWLENEKIQLLEEDIDWLVKEMRGHGVALQIFFDLKDKQNQDGRLLREKVQQQIYMELGKYLVQNVCEYWKPELNDFFVQMSIVPKYTLEMARAITGNYNVEKIHELAYEIGSFLKREEEYFYIDESFRIVLNQRLFVQYPVNQINELYYNVGQYFRQNNRLVEALEMFEKCGNYGQISNILVESARENPGSGNLYGLRKYYLSLSEEEIASKVELMVGMCMLQSLLLNEEQSEYWYEKLKQYDKQKLSEGEKRAVRTWIAYLDIACPHRGTKNLVDIVKSVGRLVMNRQVNLPEFCVTANAPTTMNGGKDFCNWSKKDRELARSIGKVLSLVLGKYGAGLVELALAESFFEKGEDDFEIIRLLNKGKMIADTKGKIELSFVAVGFMAKLHLLNGNWVDARELIEFFYEKVKKEKLERFYANIENLLCRIDMMMGETANVESWFVNAPNEEDDFNTFARYSLLTKARIYIAKKKWNQAMALLSKLQYYAEEYERIYVSMEIKMLLAILEYRMENEQWKTTFQEMYSEAEEYHFVRIISQEGRAMEDLLANCTLQVKDNDYYEQVKKETAKMSALYPLYMKQQTSSDDMITGNALQILRYQADGLSNVKIAERMQINIGTVKYHCRENYRKLGVNGKSAALIEAKKKKLI